MTPLSTQELRTVQLRLLKEIDTFCRQNDIRYYLAWGTLLGAVRHGGYIPWDDDVDLMMFRDDYERFRLTFPDAEDPARPAVGPSADTADWPYPFLKVSDRGTRLVEKSDVVVPLGVNVDIFPIDGHPRSAVKAWLQTQEIRLVRGLLVLKATAHRDKRTLSKRVTLRLSKLGLRFLSAAFLTRWFTRCARRHEASPGNKVGVRVGPSDWAVEYAAVGDPVSVLFEGQAYSAPADADAVLTAIYGDYMRLPPVHQQVTHHSFSAYWI